MDRVLQLVLGVTGIVVPFAGPAAKIPTGWLPCYGQTVNIADYPDLFSILGNIHGGDGVTTFAIPDGRGNTVAGADSATSPANRLTTAAGGVDGATLGAKGGSQAHVLTVAQMPAHAHSINDAGHAHAVGGSFNGSGTSSNGGYITQGGNNVATTTSGTGISLNNNGGGAAHPNVQPTLVLTMMIKT